MKRSLVLLGAVALLLTAGCGGSGTKPSANTTSTSGSSDKAMKVGLVTDISGLNDRGFNHLSYVGLQRAEAEFGVQGEVFQTKAAQEYVPNLSTFARRGYDLTVGVGFTEAIAIDTVANAFPKSHLTIVNVDQTEEPHKPPNLLGLLFKEQETGYLVGYLAGLEEKRRPGKDMIGSVGGEKQPPVTTASSPATAPGPGPPTRHHAARRTGTRRTSWIRPSASRSRSTRSSRAQVSSSRSQATAGSARSTRRRRNTSGVSESTQTTSRTLGHTHFLTSAVKRVESAVFDAISIIRMWKFRGGNITFGPEGQRCRDRQDQPEGAEVRSCEGDAGPGRHHLRQNPRTSRRRSSNYGKLG